MASSPDPSIAPSEDTPKVAPVDGPVEATPTVNKTNVRVEDGTAANGKKKPKKRTRGAKKRGTGFEEFYCDPPLSVAEYNEEREVIYPQHRPFVDRIEECIQRFRARRRLDVEREQLFSIYLMLGGIDATVRQFQGTSKIGDDMLADASKSAVREMTADDVIQRGVGSNNNPRFFNPNDSAHWTVDFTGVAAGFLSEHIPSLMGRDMQFITKAADVVLNFLKYVDAHDVCPEYADDIRNARKVCEHALEEFPAINELGDILPGHFNTSLRVLYLRDEDKDSVDFRKGVRPDVRQASLSRAATLSIMMGSSSVGNTTKFSVVDTTELTYEVRAITLPNDVARAKYKAINRHLADRNPEIEPCGTITARPVIVLDGWDNTANATIPPAVDVDTEFILEEGILKLLRVGMKLRMTVCTLNTGRKFVKDVTRILPSFYVFLPQELMLQYKAPVPNERPSRSVHDVDNDADGGSFDEMDD